jgi:hypothetical protein
MFKQSYNFFISALLLLMAIAGCKKGTFDINSVNPNVPSSVSPKFTLSAALTATANETYNTGYPDFANRYMGYWAFSGDYGGYGTEAVYNTTTSFAVFNWDNVFTTLENYKFVVSQSTTPNSANYLGIAKIMQSFLFQRLVDLYNNIPYTQALNGGTTNYPKYDDAKTVYKSLVSQLDTAILVIKNAPLTADNPTTYDVIFGGNMTKWTLFANTIKLKILLNLTQTSDGPAFITSELNGLTTASFLGAGQDAIVNPGYSNASVNQQNPMWQNVGFATNGTSPTTGNSFNRANSYAVNFYTNTHDPRLSRFYALNNNGVVQGRAFGSQDGSEHNTIISAVGPGIINAPTQGAPLLPAFESLFFQAEAQLEGYIPGGAAGALASYNSGVSESFRLIGVPGYAAAATTYVQLNDTRTNFATSPNQLQTLIGQEWASLNMYDPITAWNNWRRLGIPADLPVSIYPGTTATHVPLRLLYPASEYSNNTANVNAQGTINNMTSKIFWMP